MKKLSLNRETLVPLGAPEAAQVQGAAPVNTQRVSCGYDVCSISGVRG